MLLLFIITRRPEMNRDQGYHLPQIIEQFCSLAYEAANSSKRHHWGSDSDGSRKFCVIFNKILKNIFYVLEFKFEESPDTLLGTAIKILKQKELHIFGVKFINKISERIFVGWCYSYEIWHL